MFWNNSNKASVLFGVLFFINACTCVPKKYEIKSNFRPNDWQYQSTAGAVDQVAEASATSDQAVSDTGSSANITDADRTQRLGFSTGYGTGSQGYPGTGSGVGVYSPLKIDLGGVLIGTLVGIGALFLFPKLINAFGGGGGYGYGRSDDSELTSLSAMMAKIDETLGQYNIDSSSCVQRAVCSYVRQSEEKMATGKADKMDKIVHTISGNSLVEYMLDGTAIKEALEAGKKKENGVKCDTLYPGCPLNQSTSLQMLSKLLPA